MSGVQKGAAWPQRAPQPRDVYVNAGRALGESFRAQTLEAVPLGYVPREYTQYFHANVTPAHVASVGQAAHGHGPWGFLVSLLRRCVLPLGIASNAGRLQCRCAPQQGLSCIAVSAKDCSPARASAQFECASIDCTQYQHAQPCRSACKRDEGVHSGMGAAGRAAAVRLHV